MFWDHLSLNEESIHQVMILFSDRGTPQGYRHMNGYVGHTHKFVNDKGEWVYTQMHFLTDQGVKSYTAPEAAKLDGENPDSATQDLFESIEKGEFPSWTVHVQVMTHEQATKWKHSVFDLTKVRISLSVLLNPFFPVNANAWLLPGQVWPHSEFPLRKVGKFTLNKNVENWFAEIEQVAFSPSHLVPGIEPSNDPVLQSRLFSYPDTHRHRLGPSAFYSPALPFLIVVSERRADNRLRFDAWQTTSRSPSTLPLARSPTSSVPVS